MIWLILSIALLGMGYLVFNVSTDYKHYETGGKIRKWLYDNDDFSGIIAACGLFLGILAIIICVGMIIINHYNINRQIMLSNMERDKILHKIECIDSDYEDISKTDIIEEIYTWNKKCESYKHYSYSPWTNLLFSRKVADSLDYIEIED